MRRSWGVAGLLCLGLGSTAAAQTAAPTPEAAPAAPAPVTTAARDGDVEVRVLPRPRIRWGKDFSLELTAKVQGDTARFDPLVDEDDEDFTWRRRRLGIKGELFGHVSFEVERELGDDDDPWRDVYVNVKTTDLFEVRAGKFKVPFSLDNLTGSTSHDFVFRSIAARTMAPGRDWGAMVHGRTAGRRLTYALGVFDDDEDQTSQFFDDDKGSGSFGRTVGGRLTLQPLDTLRDLPRGLRNLEIGASGAWSSVPEGLFGLEGESVFGHDFFEPVYVKGDRLRAGVDAALLAGPTSIKAEWLSAWDERNEQGLADVDLPKAYGRGWYVAGTWLVTGEDKGDDVRPRRPFLQKGLGAVEIAARYERFSLGSVDDAGEPPFANPRAANLLPNRDDAVTIGVTWYLNRWFRLQGNAIHESFDDVERAPIAGRAGYWSYVGRFQFVL